MTTNKCGNGCGSIVWGIIVIVILIIAWSFIAKEKGATTTSTLATSTITVATSTN